ncbi:MAG: ABC transporter substrate-binding protein [Sedimentisphaerales bacterium]
MCRKICFKWLTLFATFLVVFCVFLNSCGKKAPQQKVYRVGILSGLDFFASAADGFKARMTELGYVKGKNVVYDLQKTNIDLVAYKNILKKFVADKVDLIFVFPTEASQEAKAATQGTDIPVVFAIANIEGTNLIETVRHPGGNITGVRWPGPDLAAKRFEIMHELVPQTKRMWLPYQRGYPIVASQLEILRPMAASSGITLLEVPANNATELEAELQERAKSVGVNDTDAILIMVEPLGVTPENFVVLGKFADEHKIPIGGALMSVGGYESVFGLTPQNIPVGRQAAFLADKILKGISAGTIPVVSSEGFFQFNYKAAQKLGLNVPEGLLSRAGEIIR